MAHLNPVRPVYIYPRNQDPYINQEFIFMFYSIMRDIPNLIMQVLFSLELFTKFAVPLTNYFWQFIYIAIYIILVRNLGGSIGSRSGEGVEIPKVR
jgi:hypothetical protein